MDCQNVVTCGHTISDNIIPATLKGRMLIIVKILSPTCLKGPGQKARTRRFLFTVDFDSDSILHPTNLV